MILLMKTIMFWHLLLLISPAFLIVIALIIRGIKASNPKKFNAWMKEVVRISAYYHLTVHQKEMLPNFTDWLSWYGEGMTPWEAMNRYYRKINNLTDKLG